MRPDQTVGKKQFILLNQGGQALVEYILMLVISLSLLFAAKKLFTNFNTYADNYIGGYMACLMEFGELPTLGIRVEDLKKHQGGNAKTCDAKFEKFTIAGGRPPSSSGGGGGSGSSGSGSTKKASSGKNGSDSSSGSSVDSASNKSSSSDLFGSNSNKNKKNNSYAGGRIQRTDDGYGSGDNGFDSAKANSKVTIIEDEDGDKKKSSAYGRTTMVNNSYRRPGYGDKYRAITGSELQQMELTIKKQKPKPVATRVKIADIEDKKRGPARYTVDPPEFKKVAEVEENTEMFSFGGIFRWLLIVGMVVAIVIFFGGQLLNYSKSQE